MSTQYEVARAAANASEDDADLGAIWRRAVWVGVAPDAKPKTLAQSILPLWLLCV